MSQWDIDPDLRDRRLATLVRLLQAAAATGAREYDLTAKEMSDWAHQCSNLLNAPVRKRKAKPIEEMTDDELLS